jgi:hypothetical protein
LDKVPTQTKSFRLDADILEALDTESARRGTSVNNLTNQILRKWVKFDRFVQDFGYIMVSVHDFLRGLNVQDETTIRTLASESGRRFPKDLILFTGQRNDLKTCIRFVENILCDYMKWATYHTSSTEIEYVLTLRHNYGSKWSLALQTVLQTMFEANTNIKPKFTVTDSTVLMVIEKSAIPETVAAASPEQSVDSGQL